MVDLPDADEYSTAGRELLDFAWDVVATLLTDIDDASDFGVSPDEISDGYWKAARRRLSTALSTTQQGVEFCLKGRIAEISPYLLIADPPSRWPSPYESSNLTFRTIDAQDLLRVLDTFAATPMSDAFASHFHRLRNKRNRIIHSVDKKVVVGVTEVLETILFMHRSLFPTENWAAARRRFLEIAPEAEIGANARNRVRWEMSVVVDLLQPAKVKRFFRIDKKQRRYICPECHNHSDTTMGYEHKLAVLRPEGPKSTSLYCAVCDESHSVYRQVCSRVECKGNVMHRDWGCLTCND